MKKYAQILTLLMVGSFSLSQCAWRDWFYREYIPNMPSEIIIGGKPYTSEVIAQVLAESKAPGEEQTREEFLNWLTAHGYGAPELQLRPGGYVAGALALLGASYAAYRYMFPGKPLPATEELANAEVEGALNAEEKQKAAELASAVIITEVAAVEAEKEEEVIKPSRQQRQPLRQPARADRTTRTRNR